MDLKKQQKAEPMAHNLHQIIPQKEYQQLRLKQNLYDYHVQNQNPKAIANLHFLNQLGAKQSFRLYLESIPQVRFYPGVEQFLIFRLPQLK